MDRRTSEISENKENVPALSKFLQTGRNNKYRMLFRNWMQRYWAGPEWDNFVLFLRH
jgi:hypothetical protein